MKICPGPPPEAREIAEKNWSYLHGLDLRQWLKELERLCTFLGPLIPFDDPSGWSEIIGDCKVGFAYIGAPTVELLERPNEGERYHRVHALQTPSLLVQLNAPDDVIIKEFNRVLNEARERYPAPAKNPGRKAYRARFDRGDIHHWLNYKIVPLAELIAWRACLGEQDQERYRQVALGKWLGLDETKTSRAVKFLHAALAAIPALRAQIVAEAGEARRDELEKVSAQKPI
jgi:hypothetical protein